MHHKYISMQTRSRSVQHVAVLNSRFALIKCRRASTVCLRIINPNISIYYSSNDYFRKHIIHVNASNSYEITIAFSLLKNTTGVL